MASLAAFLASLMACWASLLRRAFRPHLVRANGFAGVVRARSTTASYHIHSGSTVQSTARDMNLDPMQVSAHRFETILSDLLEVLG